MRKTIIFAGLLALCSAASAQVSATTTTPTYTVTPLAPTTGGGDDQVSKNKNCAGTADVTKACVKSEIELIIPKATALHLDVPKITFDLRPMDGAGWPNNTTDGDNYMACVEGLSDTDTDTATDGRAKPLGVGYQVGVWPHIEIKGGAPVNNYPPIRIDQTTGELVPGSKDYFVCFKSFLLQKFSNGSTFELTVERKDSGTQSIEHLYIQDNPCYVGAGLDNPLFSLPNNSTRSLFGVLTGPTGAYVKNDHAKCGYKSWLDDLVVVAVKINADKAGTNTADLYFTLTTVF